MPLPDLPEARLLQRCGPHLRSVLEGRADPLEALFGDGGAAAEALFIASPFARAINQIAAAALDEILTGRGPVTLLEIGCGTGGTTAALLPRLRLGDRYVATDVSAGFVAAIRRRLGVEGGVLDIDPFARRAGLRSGQRGCAGGGERAARDTEVAAETLAHAATLLAPDGQLLLIENSGTLAVGRPDLRPDRWRCGAFADTDLRPGHALLPPATWTTLLQEAGFAVSVHQPGDARTEMLSGQFVAAARRRRVRRIGSGWLRHGSDAVAVLDAALTQVPAAVAEPMPPRLWLVTRGARAERTGEAPDPVQATLWGMANSVAIEHPELRLTMLDVDDRAAIPAVVASGTAETRPRRPQRTIAAGADGAVAPPPAPAAIRPTSLIS